MGKKGVYLLPEERIFTLKAGSLVKLQLDKKPIDITFPEDMKVIHPSTLIKQEQKLNDQTLKTIQAKRSRNTWLGILGSLLTIVTTLLAYRKKNKK